MGGRYYSFIPLVKEETLAQVPTINELCLVALSHPIRSQQFIKIGLSRP
jgi:hypothetical protein